MGDEVENEVWARLQRVLPELFLRESEVDEESRNQLITDGPQQTATEIRVRRESIGSYHLQGNAVDIAAVTVARANEMLAAMPLISQELAEQRISEIRVVDSTITRHLHAGSRWAPDGNEVFTVPRTGEYRWRPGWNYVELRTDLFATAEVITLEELRNRQTAEVFMTEVMQQIDALPAEEKKEPANIKANLGYIQMLMASYGFRLTLDQMHDLAKMDSKAEINKKMAEFYEKFKAGKSLSPETDEVIAKAAESLSEYYKARFEEKKSQIRKDVDSYRRNADHYSREVNAALEKMNAKVIELEQLKDDPSDMKKMFDSLKENTFWKIEKFVDGVLYFESQDVIIRYVEKQQNIDMTVNFGPMYAMWFTRNSTIKIDVRRSKLIVNGYPHPHVGTEGSVCWGNAAASHTSNMRTMNISASLTILQSLLQTYNPGSPFQRLDAFYARANPSVLKGEFEHRQVRLAWVHSDPDNYGFTPDFSDTSEEYQDQDGNPVRRIRVYARFNREFGIQVDDLEYIRSTNYRYFELSDSLEVDEDSVETIYHDEDEDDE